MAHEIGQILSNHPRFFMSVAALAVLLAGVGLWYVISRHLHVILITLLCAGGMASGAVVLYRGFSADMRDLIGVGVFLVLIFPIIFVQAIRLSYAEPVEAKAADKQIPGKTPAGSRTA